MKAKDNSNIDSTICVPTTNSLIPEASRKIPMPSVKPPKGIKEHIVVLRVQSSIDDDAIKILEDKYSKRFDCKVVVLESNLGFVGTIDR